MGNTMPVHKGHQGHRKTHIRVMDSYELRRYSQTRLNHYRVLHDALRVRTPDEIARMEKAAKRRPGGKAAELLKSLAVRTLTTPKKRPSRAKAAAAPAEPAKEPKRAPRRKVSPAGPARPCRRRQRPGPRR